jgi:Domain of unknown function (DUF4214)
MNRAARRRARRAQRIRRRLVLGSVTLGLGLVGGTGASLWAAGSAGEFVDAVYADLLGRDPSGSERPHWVAMLEAGAPRGEVSSKVVASSEAHQRLVDLFYDAYLGREPDRQGSAFFRRNLDRGTALMGFEMTVFGSKEYYRSVGGNDEDFLDALYRDVLDRPVDDVGRRHWGTRLERGVSRTRVAEGLLRSDENVERRVGIAFAAYLRRHPDARGEQFFARLLRQTDDWPRVWAVLTSSNEYLQHAPYPRGVGVAAEDGQSAGGSGGVEAAVTAD